MLSEDFLVGSQVKPSLEDEDFKTTTVVTEAMMQEVLVQI